MHHCLATTRRRLLAAAASAAALSAFAPHSAVAQEHARPNIVMILADDMGYSDIAPFGGEIDTPNLSALAEDGLRLNNFYASPACSPTRAMLMTGCDSHVAGLGNMAEFLTDKQKGQPGYEGYLNKACAAFPELLQDAGYRTYMVGKWHLGMTEELSPKQSGFDRSYVQLQGGAGFFDQTGNAPSKSGGRSTALYREDGKDATLPVTPDFYATDFYTDKIIDYIDSERESDDPFFAYVAFTAPHFPLQAPADLIEKYKDRYGVGYEAIADARFERMKEMGLVAADAERATPDGAWPSWEELTPEEQQIEARRMAVYAGMIDSIDQNIGRLIEYLGSVGELDNTMIVFMSDNGAEGNDIKGYLTPDWVNKNFDNSLDNTGKKDSYVAYGPNWGRVSATPFRLYKGFTTEGGVRSPAIVSYPGMSRRGEIDRELLTLKDLAPTFLDVAGVAAPVGEYKGRPVAAMSGASMLPYLEGKVEHVHGDDYVFAMELFGRVLVRKGDWKMIQMNEPWGTGEWELYNLADDPAESVNLAKERPEVLAELVEGWEQYVAENHVLMDPDINNINYSNSLEYFKNL